MTTTLLDESTAPNGHDSIAPEDDTITQYAEAIVAADLARTFGKPPEGEPSWRVCDPTDPLSRTVVQRNLLDLTIALDCIPAMSECVDDVRSRLAVRMGVSDRNATHYIDVGLMLTRFPGVRAHLADGHMPFACMRRLATCLEAVPDEIVDVVEEELLAEISPRHAASACPSERRLLNICQRIIHSHHPPARPRDDESHPDERHPILHVDARHKNTTRFTLILNKAEAHEIQLLIDSAQNARDCTRTEAFLALLRGESTVNITLNLYRPLLPVPEDRVHIAGHWLHPHITEDWMNRITHIAAPGWSRTEGYSPTEAIRTAVMGRDGHCRFPSCDVPAERCDLDHVRRWDGGEHSETSTDNLHCLCRTHHRLKTAGQWDVTLHRDGTETWTSHGDGHRVVTEPGGVLQRETFEHRAIRKVRSLAEYNENWRPPEPLSA